jgi:hypothetical protein
MSAAKRGDRRATKRKPMSRHDREKLLSLAERLRAGENPESIAEELERLASGKPLGRPRRPPAERGYLRLERGHMAEAIFNGTLSKDEYPPEFALTVERAKGKRTEADEVTAEILGVSLRTIELARAINRGVMGLEQWEESNAMGWEETKERMRAGEIQAISFDGTPLSVEAVEKLKAEIRRMAKPAGKIDALDD